MALSWNIVVAASATTAAVVLPRTMIWGMMLGRFSKNTKKGAHFFEPTRAIAKKRIFPVSDLQCFHLAKLFA
jgi:hypothetical protein